MDQVGINTYLLLNKKLRTFKEAKKIISEHRNNFIPGESNVGIYNEMINSLLVLINTVRAELKYQNCIKEEVVKGEELCSGLIQYNTEFAHFCADLAIDQKIYN